MSTVEMRLGEVRARLTAAVANASRAPGSVTLVAVSKGQPASAVAQAYAAGQRDFGENYAQELRDKARELAGLKELRWHFLGPLQTNKVKYVTPVTVMLHALDRVELATALGERLTRDGRTLDVLLEVNVGSEANKHGVSPAQAPALLEAVRGVPALRVVGLMCVPPQREDLRETQADFAALAALARRLGLRELSMGMSHDFEVAVAQGATLVRVGTAIFGARPNKG